MDVVAYYADFGRPYAALLERMATSAKAVMPECRTVLLTPDLGCDGSQYFDLQIDAPLQCPRDGIVPLSRERCRANVSWLTQTGRPTICCDPDVEFVARPHFPDVDIALVWRDKPDQRVSAALFYSRPGQRYFWERYARIVFSLPTEMWAWWADQLAFTLMVGSYNRVDQGIYCDGSHVWFLDPRYSCGLPEQADKNAWALHYKGQRKGSGWERWFAGEGNVAA